MNKSELIAEIATQADITKAEAGRVIDATTAAITASLKNPRTGAELKVAARNAPAFTAGKALKDAVN
jgi:nucleoid DNA-binding protein